MKTALTPEEQAEKWNNETRKGRVLFFPDRAEYPELYEPPIAILKEKYGWIEERFTALRNGKEELYYMEEEARRKREWEEWKAENPNYFN